MSTMTPWIFLLVSLAGGLGAAARMLLDGLLKGGVFTAPWGRRFPWATAVINVTGSFLLGLLTGLAGVGLLGSHALAVLGTGFMGGYTTFSTAAVETVRLAQERRWGAAAANLFGVLLAGCAAALLGLWCGAALGS